MKAWGVLGLCILFDVFATAKVSELNARKAFVKTNIANFLKTPFLIIVVVVAYYFDINDWIILSFFFYWHVFLDLDIYIILIIRMAL